jgi:hypothetical protein
MAKVKTLSVSAINDGMNIVKNGIAFGDKLAQANAKFADRLTRQQKTISRLVADIQMFGISDVRMAMAQELYDAELKGRTLASVIQSRGDALVRAITKAVDAEEEKNIKLKFELEATLKFENLKFLQGILAKKAVPEAVAQEAEVEV